MKHILIILSFLLLSSPVISYGQSGKTLYGWGDFPDHVWKEFGDKETQKVYKGEVENGVPNGLGFLIFPNGDKYVGEWKDGKPNGQGTLNMSNGNKYVGEYKDGKTWNGTGYDKNGNIQVKFVNGEYIKQ